MKKCLVIGATMLDIHIYVDHLPKTSEDIYIQKENYTIGGCALNVADILHHFQVPFTFFSPIGTGKNANIIKSLANKLNYQSVLQDMKDDNGYSLCLIEQNGERTFLNLAGVECHFQSSWFDRLDASLHDCVYISGYEVEGEGGEAILQFLEKHPHLTIYYAAGPRFIHISQQAHERLFKLHPIIHINKKEALEFTGADNIHSAINDLTSQTNSKVIVTDGPNGAYINTDGQITHVHSTPSQVVNTTGAGDSHIGAFIAYTQLGHTYIDSIVCANKVASKVVASHTSLLSQATFNSIDF